MAVYRLARFVCLLLVLAVLSICAAAQSLTGAPPFNSIDGEINEGNLNVHTTIPLVSKPGLIPYTSAFVIDSNIWTIVNGNAWLPIQSNGVALVPVHMGDFEDPTGGYITGTTTPWGYCWNVHFVFVDSNNTTHAFGMVSGAGRASDGCATSGTVYTNDGSGYTFNWVWSGNSNPTFYGGSVLDIGGNNVRNGFTDTNGNTITASTTNNVTTITDSLNTTVATVTRNVNGYPNGYATKVAYTGGNGATQYTINYSTSITTLATAFNCPGIAEYNYTAYFPTSIVLPDGSTYGFTWEQTPGKSSAYSTGRIAKLTLPTGGAIKYAYTGVNCTDGTPNTVTRKPSVDNVNFPNTWTYARTGTPPSSSTTTITAPSGDKTTVQFAYYQEILRKVYTGAATGTPLLQVTHCYDFTSPAGACSTATGPSSQTQAGTAPLALTVLRSYNGGANDQTVTYYGVTDSQGNRLHLATEVDSFDFGASSPTRIVTTTYGSDNGSGCVAIGGNILNRPCNSGIYDAGGAHNYSWTRNTYDSHGNTTKVVRQVNGNVLSLDTAFTYYSNGALQTVTEPNGTVTTYSNMQCNSSFPQTISSSAVTWTSSATYDCTGGVITSSTDPSGAISYFDHVDPFWRTTSLRSPWKNGLDVTTTTAYLGPTQRESITSFNGGASVIDEISYSDGLGRLIRTQSKDGASTWSTISRSYDTNGRIISVSGPCDVAAGANCSSPTTTYGSYDGMNRIGQITDGSGGWVQNTYYQNDVLQQLGPAPTGEGVKAKRSQYDTLGRLTSVCEIQVTIPLPGAGTCGQTQSTTGYWTQYSYDAAGHLTQIAQNTQSNPPIWEVRTFTYDLVDRLLSETHPESGTTSYTYDADSTCNYTHNGVMVKRTWNSNSYNCFLYDGLHRLTDVIGSYNTRFRYESSANTPPSGYTASNTANRMTEAYTTSGPSTIITDEWFSYADNGNLIDFYQKTPNSGGYMHMTASYYEDGHLNTLSAVPGLAKSWTYGLDAYGRTNTVSDGTEQVVSAVTYNPDGTLNAVTYLNGSDSYGYDAAGRMNAFNYSVAGSTYNGALTWNANGTLNTFQTTNPFHTADNSTCSYGYDDLARLTNTNCGTVGTQTYGYDSFGNMNKTANGVGLSFSVGYNAHNRITSGISVVYDADGNITNDGNGNVYGYDPNFHYIQSVNGTSITYDAFGQAVEIGTTPVLYSPVGKLGMLPGGAYNAGAEVHIPSPAGDLEYAKGVNTYARVNHPDWLGSVRFTSNPHTNVSSSGASYAPFGESTGWGTNARLDFTGQDQDSGPANTYDFPARKYSAVQSRWISPDPTLGNLANPQTFNKYAYMGGNPLVGTDPSGLCYEGHECDLADSIIGWGSFASEDDPSLVYSGADSFGWVIGTSPGWLSDQFCSGCYDTITNGQYDSPGMSGSDILTEDANLGYPMTSQAGGWALNFAMMTGGRGGIPESLPNFAYIGKASQFEQVPMTLRKAGEYNGLMDVQGLSATEVIKHTPDAAGKILASSPAKNDLLSLLPAHGTPVEPWYYWDSIPHGVSRLVGDGGFLTNQWLKLRGNGNIPTSATEIKALELWRGVPGPAPARAIIGADSLLPK